jgi:hypothetical protein
VSLHPEQKKRMDWKKGICGICPAGCRVEVALESGKLVDIRQDNNHPLGMIYRRGVTLSPSLVELFKIYRADQELLRIQLGISLNADDFVFIRPDGSPINPNSITLWLFGGLSRGLPERYQNTRFKAYACYFDAQGGYSSKGRLRASRACQYRHYI